VALHVREQKQLSRFCSVSIGCDADAALIRLEGEFDLSCEDGLRTEVAHITAWQPNSVILDLGDVTFIDSHGLRMLFELDAAARRDGFELTLLGAVGQVRRSLRITGLDLLLPLVEPHRGLGEDSGRWRPPFS
jgi:anti-sigma B factor antagonist